MEFKRSEGTTVCVPSDNCSKGIHKERKKILILFLISMFFLSSFVFIFPLGEVRTSLDETLHLLTSMVPIACGFFLIVFEVRKERRKVNV